MTSEYQTNYRFRIIALLILVTAFSWALPKSCFAQTTPEIIIYHAPDEQFLQYIQDSLLFGGGVVSNPQYFGRENGRDLFMQGNDIGFDRGLVLCNGWVYGTTTYDGGDNKNGHQTRPFSPETPNVPCDSLGPYIALPPDQLKDADMDWVLGYLLSPGNPKPDTAVDPSVIMFKFKPYYNYIKMSYVFASEEYQFNPGPGGPGGGGGDPNDLDFTGADMADFMAIILKQSPGQQINPAMIISNVGSDAGPGGPPKVPVCVKTVNQSSGSDYYISNIDQKLIYDGFTEPLITTPLNDVWVPVLPCVTYWIKVGVADYRNGMVVTYQGQDIDLSYLVNSSVFLKAFGLISGDGLEWTLDYSFDNNDFVADTGIVEGGCSNLILTLKTNGVVPRDSVFVRLRVDAATAGEYTITPPLFMDSLMVIPDSVTEVNYILSAIDDGINEGTGGIEKWNIRYQMDPCDVPRPDSSGFGTGNQGYTGEIRVNVFDYNPYNNATKSYGPTPSNIFHCGNDVTVTVSDVSTGGIPPYNYVWSHPAVPQIGTGINFTTPISDSPDYVYCTITDRCSGRPGYSAGKDTVIIYSQLDVQASPDFQLCQNGHTVIEVLYTNVGQDFTARWFFQDDPVNPVGIGPTYDVTWAEYGSYAPSTITFTVEVTDECGNVSYDQVNATFFPVVEITGVPLICIGDPIQLTCSGAQSYQWYKTSITPGNIIPGATSQTYTYTPTTAGFHTICVQIINDCGEQADTCYTFEVSQLLCAVELNNGTNFNVCPNVPFSITELNAYDGWTWSWFDDGQNKTDIGQTINLSLKDAGVHNFSVTAYNVHGCYNTLNFTVTVFPYAQLQATTQWQEVCVSYPTQLSCFPNGPVTASSYAWTASPPDPTLTTPNIQNPTVAPAVSTTYKCKVQDNHGCWDSTTVTVNVRPRMEVSILSAPAEACTDKQVQLSMYETVPPQSGASYYWTFGDGSNPPTSTLKTPTVIWSTPGQKSITLTITEPGCEDSFFLTYTVNPDPFALFDATENKGCQPITVNFQNKSQNLENPTYLWSFGDGTTSTDPNPTHLYENPGNYDITLTVTNQTGCVNTLTMNDLVEVYAVPVADFSAEPPAATIDNPTIRFTEEINIPYDSIHWDFGDGTTAIDEANPRHTYGVEGSYFVVMYTETEHGCWDRDTLEIGILKDIKIFVPNAFTPNGDGINDCFAVGGTTGDVIDAFRVIIFSRWGQMIYDAPITDPNCVWDGRDMNGNKVAGDSYVYRIFGKTFRGATKVYEGVVTMVE